MLELTKNIHRFFFISWLQDNADENWNILLYYTKGLRKVSVMSKFFSTCCSAYFSTEGKDLGESKGDCIVLP